MWIILEMEHVEIRTTHLKRPRYSNVFNVTCVTLYQLEEHEINTLNNPSCSNPATGECPPDFQFQSGHWRPHVRIQGSVQRPQDDAIQNGGCNGIWMEYEWNMNGSSMAHSQWDINLCGNSTGDTSKAESLYDIIPSTRGGLRLRSQCGLLLDLQGSILWFEAINHFYWWQHRLHQFCRYTGYHWFVAFSCLNSLISQVLWFLNRTSDKLGAQTTTPRRPKSRHMSHFVTEKCGMVCNGMGKSGRPHSFADISSFPCFTLL